MLISKLKLVALALVLTASGLDATAQTVHREGYVRRDGVYVPPSYATSPNASRLDNFSTRGNVNPYTGRSGTVDPFPSYNPPRTSSPYGGRQRY
jgi:hypothetical protein